MPAQSSVLEQLVAMSCRLAEPERDLVILGEGNTSARLDADTFYVKASGKELRTADADAFVAVSSRRVLDVLSGPDLDDAGVRQALTTCKVDAGNPLMPSVETFLHGFLLSLPDVNFVGHTHPTAVNSILCSGLSRQATEGRMFPDEIVCCGPASCYVEYVDPGLPLARRLREAVLEYVDRYGMAPKVILMENHGLITPGRTPRDVETAQAMCVKAARVLLGAFALGGPRFLSPDNVERIQTRPDEHYRQRLLGIL